MQSEHVSDKESTPVNETHLHEEDLRKEIKQVIKSEFFDLKNDKENGSLNANNDSVNETKEESNVGENEENSLSAKLSNKVFMKVDMHGLSNGGKGNYWTINPKFDDLNPGSHLNRTNRMPKVPESKPAIRRKAQVSEQEALDVHDSIKNLEEVIDQENNAVKSELEVIDLEEPIQQESEIYNNSPSLTGIVKESIENFSNFDEKIENTDIDQMITETIETTAGLNNDIKEATDISQGSQVKYEPGSNEAKPPVDQQRTKEKEMNPNSNI